LKPNPTVRPGWFGPAGSVVSAVPSGRSTPAITLIAAPMSTPNCSSVSSVWVKNPGQQVQQYLVPERGQLRHAMRLRVGDDHLWRGDVERLAGEGGHDRPGRLERRVPPT
jgi:hypothetical protein